MTTRRASTTRHPGWAGIYCRISDDREGTQAGVERQEKLCRDLAAKRGLEVVEVYVDNDISASAATRKRRPAYQRLLADARAGRFDVVLAYTLKRLTRRYREGADLLDLADETGVQFTFVRAPETDLNTAAGRKHFRGMVNDAIGESEEIGERVRDKFTEKRAAGEFLGGGRLFGWDEDGATLRPVEAGALAQASDEVVGGASLRSIVADWNGRGLCTSRGNRWGVITVRQVLLRPRNAGLIVHKGEIVGRYPWYEQAPVAEEMWEALRAGLSDPGRRTAPGNQPRWLGSGLYVCSGCGQPTMQVGWAASAQHRLYRCNRRFPATEGRRHVARQALALDAYVEGLIVARLCRPDAVELARDEGRPSVDVRALRAERVRIEGQQRELDEDRDANRITRERWLRRNAGFAERLAEIDRALVPVSSPRNPFVGVVDVDDPAAVWFGVLPDRSDGLSLEHRRVILRALLVVRVLPVHYKRGPFDPGCVEVERLV